MKHIKGILQKNILVVLGTRPEAIKLVPVILQLRKNSALRIFVCNTEQQKNLSNQALAYFGIAPDFKLDSMRPNQTLSGVQSRILTTLSSVYSENAFDATIVQGDTMSVFCGALVSFYNRLPIFHVEAGLRSYNLSEPFPEEAIRQMTSRIVDLHFAPTPLSYNALMNEGIPRDKIRLTGNTVIDALHCIPPETLSKAEDAARGRGIRLDDRLVLVTVHRRENHGERLQAILSAVVELTATYPEHQFVLPVHPNPNVYSIVHAMLGKIPNVILTNHLEYPELILLMRNAKLLLTDSGGMQEEAPSFGVPILVMRYETERTEGIENGFAKLVGADKNMIYSEAGLILSQEKFKTRLSGKENPYGNGRAALEIEAAITGFLR